MVHLLGGRPDIGLDGDVRTNSVSFGHCSDLGFTQRPSILINVCHEIAKGALALDQYHRRTSQREICFPLWRERDDYENFGL